MPAAQWCTVDAVARKPGRKSPDRGTTLKPRQAQAGALVDARTKARWRFGSRVSSSRSGAGNCGESAIRGDLAPGHSSKASSLLPPSHAADAPGGGPRGSGCDACAERQDLRQMRRQRCCCLVFVPRQRPVRRVGAGGSITGKIADRVQLLVERELGQDAYGACVLGASTSGCCSPLHN